MKTRWKSQSGFTLIELLVVVVVLGALAVIALPAYASMVRRARYAEAKQEMGVVAREVHMYQVEFGQYPPDENPGSRPDGTVNWPETDPYGGKYDYDHWGVGSNQCYVQVGFVGEDQNRDYALHTVSAQPATFAEVDDDLVRGIALYECTASAGSIRP